jgi:glycosyltransferase involved in cell wall biosynthesis
MILLVHKKGISVVRILLNNKEIEFDKSKCNVVFWRIAEKYPEELICWCEEKVVDEINFSSWDRIFTHDLVMASFAVNTTFLPESIGYVDQLPFININRTVKFPTWKMSSDVGGVTGNVLLKFKPLLGKIKDFEFLLNSIAKIGQQNGLLCYSSPLLVTSKPNKLYSNASTNQLFQFVYAHYSSIWTSVIMWCFIRYEMKFPLVAYLKSFHQEKYFQKEVDLNEFDISSRSKLKSFPSIDVIIPTMGRKQYLMQFLKDLSQQSLLPKSVIVVEQNPDENSVSEVSKLEIENLPFEVLHHFTHQIGACNARNIALKDVESDWIFFADDDIRISKDLLENAMGVIENKHIDALNMNCKQEGEETIFHVSKQWGSFGSGTSIVRSSFAKKCNFSSIYEHGYGEDIDFGMQLRNEGCDIIYHPMIQILHLKAPVGGFRQQPKLEWELKDEQPKPSPSLMVYAKKYYTDQQLVGFKTSMFLKYYRLQPITNPITYISHMRRRWQQSEKWAFKMMNE